MSRYVLVLLAIPALAQTAPDGDQLFHLNCAIGYCHGKAGAAGRGPRLKDRTFTRDYLVRVTRDGVPRSAMPAWGTKLSGAEIDAIAAYILKLNGTIDTTPAPTAVAAAGLHPGEIVYRGQCASCHDALPALQAPLAIPAAPRLLKRLRLADGDTFPAYLAPDPGPSVVAWDFTEPPPVRRSLDKSEITSTAPETAWRHPPLDPAAVAAVASWKR